MTPLHVATTLLLTVASPLAASRWHERVVLVFAPGPDDPTLARQRRLLATEAAGLAERDMRVVIVAGTAGPDDAALRATYAVPAERFTLVLVGKDGGEKRRADTPLPAADLFATVDRMPMRRAERAGQP